MADIKKLLESVSNLSTHKFPGYWKGTDSAKKAKSKMVGSTESILPEIHNYEKQTRTRRSIQEKLENFKEQTRVQDVKLTPSQADALALDQRGIPMRMPDEIQNVMTGSGEPLRTGSGEPVRTGFTKPGAIKYIKPDSSAMDRALEPASTPSKNSNKPVAVATPVGPSRAAQPPKDELPPLQLTTVKTPSDIDSIPAKPVRAGVAVNASGMVPPIDYVKYFKDRGHSGPLLDRNNIINSIAKVNNIPDPSKIQVGQVITINDANGTPYQYRIGKGDNLWNISKGILKGQRVQESKQIDTLLNEYKFFLEYGNAQDPNAQTTSQQKTGTPEEQAKANKEKQDQRMDIATAKSVASSIKPALPPSVDPNALAGALVKIDDQNSGMPTKPLTQPEQMAMGPMNALVTKAAVTGQTATTLSSILRNVADLAKKGKA
jgi:hypothetical protein